MEVLVPFVSASGHEPQCNEKVWKPETVELTLPLEMRTEGEARAEAFVSKLRFIERKGTSTTVRLRTKPKREHKLKQMNTGVETNEPTRNRGKGRWGNKDSDLFESVSS
jgi:hypothetical protein